MSVGNFPEMLSQRILAGITLVGRLGVFENRPSASPVPTKFATSMMTPPLSMAGRPRFTVLVPSATAA